MNQGWIYRDRVHQVDAGLTVLEYYTQQYRHSSREDWRNRIETGQILLDGHQATPDTVLQSKQHLAYHRPPWDEPDVPLSFEVLYEDQDLLVVAKPVGLPVLPGGGFLEHTLLWQLRRNYPTETPLPIHRLGRGTSGLLLLARSPQARANLSQQMRDRTIRKTYRALVGSGELPDQFTITQPIGKLPHPILGYLYGATPEGLAAHSIVQVVRRTTETTLLDVTILTGRPHQIRIHLAFAGFPLLGDPLYDQGGIPRLFPDTALVNNILPVPGDCGYSLHAHHLSFVHPSTGQPLTLVCPAPAELAIP
jgi:23S rRNA pseudouridine1911/1915/1917 synthase